MTWYRLILLSLVCLAPLAAAAWGDHGHRVVCDIAYRELTTSARSAVEALLAADDEFTTFAGSCAWGDRIRRDESFAWAEPYHFVNLPKTATAPLMRRDCQPRGCVIAGVYRYAGLLRDRSASVSDRLMALKLLGHFMGDLHQPLHVSHREDRGGNRIRVRFLGHHTNLHLVWDDAMLAADGRGWREMGRTLRGRMSDAQRAAWRAGGPVGWAAESHAVAISAPVRYAGEHPPLTELDASYLTENFPTLERQLQKAGYRLAVTLNDILR